MTKIEEAKQIIRDRVMTKVKRNGDWMETHTGIKFYPLDAREEEINIEDIAHTLANMCRFGGHTEKFYSVAQHSVLVARLVGPEYALEGLMHDAAEAYLVDLPTPIKEQIPEYSFYEDILQSLIARKFKFKYPFPDIIKKADLTAVCIEHVNLFPIRTAYSIESKIKVPKMKLSPLLPKEAKKEFMEVFESLMKERESVKKVRKV